MAEVQDINEIVAARAEELSSIHGCKVHPLLFADPITNENVIGYLKEPNRMVKLAVMDKSISQPFSASQDIVENYIIKEESSEKIWGDKEENSVYYIGACNVAFNLVKMSINQFKKK